MTKQGPNSPRNGYPREGEVYRHTRRDSCYTVVGQATLQTEVPAGDDVPLVIYRGVDGRLWARPVQEFCDGRFELNDRGGGTPEDATGR